MRFLKLRKIYLIFSLFILLQLHAHELPETNKKLITKSVNSLGLFSFYLLNNSRNLHVSPLSFNYSLLLPYLGSKGATSKELAKTLNLQKIPFNEVKQNYIELEKQLNTSKNVIKFTNSLWLKDRQSTLLSYSKDLKNNFNVEINNNAIFNPKIGALNINTWVSNNTGKLINRFLKPKEIEYLTQMAFINTIYFKGEWVNSFESKKTLIEPFLSYNEKWVQTLMMNQTSTMPYFEDNDTQVVTLSLKNSKNDLRLVLFLPKRNTSNTFNFYYSKEQEKPGLILDYLKNLEKKEVNLTIPKFFMNKRINMGDLFSALGIALSNSKKANFTGINDSQELSLSRLYQSTNISIYETGIHSAATSVTFIDTPSPSFNFTSNLKDSKMPFRHSPSSKNSDTPSFKNTNPYKHNKINFVANKPFLYAIIDMDSKLIFFLGECINPHKQEAKK